MIPNLWEYYTMILEIGLHMYPRVPLTSYIIYSIAFLGGGQGVLLADQCIYFGT